MDQKKLVKLALQGLCLIMVIGIAFYFADLVRGNENIKNVVANYGYVGMFIISVISGFNFVVPIPAISFFPLFMEAGLNFWTTICVISLGMTLADSIVYMLGNIGKKITPQSFMKKFERKIKIIHEKYEWTPLVILFIFASVAPLPNEVLLVPFAFLGYRFYYIIPVVFAGNIAFNFLYSQGILNIFSLF